MNTCKRCGLTDESVVGLVIGGTGHRELSHCILRLKDVNRKLRTVLNLMDSPICEHLHHHKQDYHEGVSLCPVEERVHKLIKDVE